MIYTAMTRKAINIAYEAHKGQYDKSGIPYIFHPFTVAMNMQDEITACAAILHDVAEDTFVTLEDLSREFPTEVIDILRLLTHDDSEDYFDYIRRIKQNKKAVIIKLADIMHNMDKSRVSETDIDEKTLERWSIKYKKALEILRQD